MIDLDEEGTIADPAAHWRELETINPDYSVARARESYAYASSHVMDTVERRLKAGGLKF